MPSVVVSYIPGSGYLPLISGDPWQSGGRFTPAGGIQLKAANTNSGAVYISLSGAFVFSGQVGCLVGSGGPTINSGGWNLSGNLNSGLMDGMMLWAGDSYFVPRVAIFNTGALSGTFQLCAGCDPACSGGFARIYIEVL